MEIPEGPWEIILWDFIVKLLKSKDPVTRQEYNSILVIMDKLTKWGYFIPCTEKMSAENLLKIYVKKVFTRHGAPMKIVSDQDPKFVLAFWEYFIAK